MFKKAEKSKSKLRLAIIAPSGAGKTMTALRIASGMGGKIAVIDTERGSASKYSDRFNFDVCELKDYSVESYIKMISDASGYDILIIDSLSHGWTELLQRVDKISKTKFHGNTFAGWMEGNPLQRSLITALLNFDGHIIATMRAKTEWLVEDTNGKKKPVKIGVGAEQGKGIEYEFDMNIEITHDHLASFSKDRTGKFQDVIIDKPGEELGKQLVEWLSTGVDTAPITTPSTTVSFDGLENPADLALPTAVEIASTRDAILALAKHGKKDECRQAIKQARELGIVKPNDSIIIEAKHLINSCVSQEVA